MPLKRFLMASALALSFVVSAPTVAKADPITAAIVTWAGFTAGTTAFAVATFVVNSALYAAGSWAVTKAAKALGLMKSNVAERQASVTTLSLGETPREAVVGIACVGGSLIDAWNHGGKYGTDYVTRRVALADHVLDGLIGYYVDDTYYPFNGNGVQPGFNGALQLTFVNATRDGAFPPPYMLQAGVGLTSADRCPSVAEIWITYKFDDQVWTRGHPGLKFVVRGLRAYDPRFDPQYGYTGPSPQTWDDVSTHRFSENAAVVRYNIQRGVYAVGRHGELEHLLIGRGLTADEAPAARIIAAANVCDEIVDGLPRYTVGGAISSAQAHIEVEEMFAAATAGQIVQRDGGVEVEPGQAKAAVVTITDADLVAGEAISFDEFTPDTDGGRVNTVIARYVEPSQLYKDHSGAVLRDQADIVEDGGPRELTLPLMLVTSKGQADRCAEITRRGARLERRARIALVPMLLAGRASAELEDGDIIAWQSNRYHEGATVRYRIEAYGVDEGWRNTLQLREMASSVFGQADPVEDRAAPPPTPIPVDALQLIGVQAEAIILPGDTSTVPAIRFKWDVTTADTAMTAIRAEVRRLGETDVAPTRTEEIDAGVMVVTNGVGPDQDMQARLVPLGDPTKPVVPSPWITVSTSTIIAGDLSPESPTRIAVTEITDRLVSVEQISATNAAAVADLEEVFGDTVSAAESALAAGQAANLAVLKAGEAGDAAAASNISAGIASTKADEAGVSAQASNAAKVAAEIARDGSSGSAAASATNASQALAYRDQAGQFASSSSGSANQAATSAGQSLAYRDQSASSAATANAASISAGVSATYARQAVAQSIPNAPGLSPSGFATNQWTVQNYTGTHDNLENKLTIEPSNYSVVGGNLRITNMDTVHIHTCRATSRPSGHKVRCSTTFRRVTNGGDISNNRVTLYAFGWDAAGNVVATIEITSALNPTVAQGVQTLSYDLSDANLGANCVFLRTMTRVWSTAGATEVISIDTQDVDSEAQAANSAAIATTQAANASASASSASVSANLAATVGASSSVMNNGRFINWPSSQPRPTGWEDWANCNQSPNIQTAIGWNGRRFARMNYQPSMNDQGMRQDIDGFRGTTEPYNLDVEVAIPFGGANGTGFFGALVLIQCLDANGNYLGDADAVKLWLEKDINGNVPGAGNGDGRIYRFNKRVNLVPNTRLARIYLMSRWTVVGPPGVNEAKTLDWYSVSLSPMSAAESAVAGLSAQLSITASVAADAQARLSSARFEVIAAAGSDPAQLLIRADQSGSLAALVASEIAFSNVIGGAVVRVMRIVNGVVIISGKLVIGNPAAARLELDGINLRIDMYNEAGTLKFRLGRLS